MYGFHKVIHANHGGLVADDAEDGSWEFRSDLFKRNRPDLLLKMKRKAGSGSAAAAASTASYASGVAAGAGGEVVPVDHIKVLQELQAIREHQFIIQSSLQDLQLENQVMFVCVLPPPPPAN